MSNFRYSYQIIESGAGGNVVTVRYTTDDPAAGESPEPILMAFEVPLNPAGHPDLRALDDMIEAHVPRETFERRPRVRFANMTALNARVNGTIKQATHRPSPPPTVVQTPAAEQVAMLMAGRGVRSILNVIANHLGMDQATFEAKLIQYATGPQWTNEAL